MRRQDEKGKSDLALRRGKEQREIEIAKKWFMQMNPFKRFLTITDCRKKKFKN